jgi:hypothetical protein
MATRPDRPGLPRARKFRQGTVTYPVRRADGPLNA